MESLSRSVPPRLAATLFLVAGMAASGAAYCDERSATAAASYVARAQDYREKGDLRAAVIELKNALDQSPDSADARRLLGMIYLDLGEDQAAEKELRRAVELGVAEPTLALPLARALLYQGKNKELLDTELDIKALPESEQAEMLALRGDASFSLGKLEAAADLFDAALAIDPNLAAAETGKARLSLAHGDRAVARSRLNAVLKHSPSHAPAWMMLGAIELSERNLDAAVAAYTQAMQDPRERDEAQYSRTLVRLQMGQLEAAAQDIAELRQRLPKSPRVNYAEGLLRAHQERYDEARPLFEAVTDAIPTHLPALYWAGVTNAIAGNLETARDFLGRALTLNPNGMAAQKMLALVESYAGNQAEAARLAKAVLAQAPTDVASLSVLAAALGSEGKNQAELDTLRRLSEVAPDSAEARARLGTLMANTTKTDEAIAELQRAIALDPGNVIATNSLIRQYLRAGEPDKALALARSYQERRPEDVNGYLLLGTVQLGQKDLDGADRSFQTAIRIQPASAGAHSGSALVAIQRNQLDVARTQFQEALKQDPDGLETLMNLGRVEAMRGDRDAMLKVLKEAMQRHPKAPEPGLVLGRYQLKAGQIDEALGTVTAARQQLPDDPNLLDLAAAVELARLRDPRAASGSGAASGQDDPRVLLRLANALVQGGDPGAARAELERALTVQPDNLEAKIGLARLALVQGRVEDAEARITALKPRVGSGNTDFLLTQAELAERKGDWPGAVMAYQSALTGAKTSLIARRLSNAQWQAGEKDAAVLGLERWLAEHGNDLSAQLELAQRYLGLGRQGEAIAAYQSAITLAPENALVRNNLASALTATDPQAAVIHAEKAYALAPEVTAVQDTLAGVLLRLGDLERAASLNAGALTKEPDNRSFRLRRAQIEVARGRKDDAIRSLRALLDEEQPFPERSEAEAMLSRLSVGSSPAVAPVPGAHAQGPARPGTSAVRPPQGATNPAAAR